MAKAIYQAIDGELRPPMEGVGVESDVIRQSQTAWKKLSYAIAKGVIEHIQVNMEIRGIQTKGDVSTTVSGRTGSTDPGPHRHSVDLSGEQTDVVFTQSNDGTGLVE
jgi:hypothetical protein